MSRAQAAIFLIAISAVLVCGCASRPSIPRTLPAHDVEARVREVLADVEAGNAQKLFPLIPQDERDKEKLTEAQVGALLRITSRCLKGKAPGPLVLNGDQHNLVGIVHFRVGGNVVTKIVVNAQTLPDGTIKSPAFIWNLLMETADAVANPTGTPLSSLESGRASVRGLKELRDELKSSGPQLILKGERLVMTFDEVIAEQEGKVRALEAEGASGSS